MDSGQVSEKTNLINNQNYLSNNEEIQLYDENNDQKQDRNKKRTKLILLQGLMFAITFMNYAVLHASRSVWSAATKDLTLIYPDAINNDIIANMNTCFLISYGVGGFFSGQLADQFKKRYLLFFLYSSISINLVCLAFLSFVPSEKQSKFLNVYYILKIIFGALQSPCWAINLVILSKWFPKTGRGLLMGVWASNTSVGDIIGVQIYKLIVPAGDLDNTKQNWQIPFYFIAILIQAMAFLSLFFVIEDPEDIGLFINQQNRQDQRQNQDFLLQTIDQNQIQQESLFSVQKEEQKIQKIEFWQAFKIPGILEFCVSMFFGKFVMSSLFYWYPTFLQDEMLFPKNQALDIYNLFSTGSFFGNVIMGIISDLISIRTPVFLAGVIISSLMTILIPLQQNYDSQGSSLWIKIFVFIQGGCLIGTSIIIAAIECDIGNHVKITQGKNALGTFTGIIDGVASIGSIFSQKIILAIQNKFGWRDSFYVIAFLIAISALPALNFLKFEINQIKQNRERIYKQQNQRMQIIQKQLEQTDQ